MTTKEPRIFISYRRDDTSAYAAGWLHDQLCLQFGAPNVFKDVVTLSPGVDFSRRTEQALASCTVVVALIGERWAGHLPDGRVRVQEPGDWVRFELETAFDSGLTVIPVLVSGAALPDGRILPPALRPLLGRHAVVLGHETFGSDFRRLVAAIDGTRGGHFDSDEARRAVPTRVSRFVEVERLYRAQVDLDVAPYKFDPFIKTAARRDDLDRLVDSLEDGEQPANLALTSFNPKNATIGGDNWRGLTAVTPRRLIYVPARSKSSLFFLPYSQILQVDLGMTRTNLIFTLRGHNIGFGSFKPMVRANEFATYIRERLADG